MRGAKSHLNIGGSVSKRPTVWNMNSDIGQLLPSNLSSKRKFGSKLSERSRFDMEKKSAAINIIENDETALPFSGKIVKKPGRNSKAYHTPSVERP